MPNPLSAETQSTGNPHNPLTTAEIVRSVPKYKGMRAATNLNFRLRENLPLKPDDQETMAQLESLMRPTAEDMTVWRGVPGSQFATAPVGDVVHDPGYMSASKNVLTARQFSQEGLHPQPTLLHISVPKGTPTADLTAHGEGEHVLPRGYGYKILSRRPGPEGRAAVVSVLLHKHHGSGK